MGGTAGGTNPMQPAGVSDPSTVPAWASQLKSQERPDFSGMVDTETKPAAPVETKPQEPLANLGFPSTDPTAGSALPMATPTQLAPPSSAFNQQQTAFAPGATPAPVAAAPAAAAPAAAAPDPNAPSPDDWLYPGNLPMSFQSSGNNQFGMPQAYSATGANYTPGYGAAGNFGGVAGYGPQQQGLQDQQLLPSMTAGTKLTGPQIDQYNRIRRSDYDRYMAQHGVGYDLTAYRNALNSQVAPANALVNPHNYYGSGG